MKSNIASRILRISGLLMVVCLLVGCPPVTVVTTTPPAPTFVSVQDQDGNIIHPSSVRDRYAYILPVFYPPPPHTAGKYTWAVNFKMPAGNKFAVTLATSAGPVFTLHDATYYTSDVGQLAANENAFTQYRIAASPIDPVDSSLVDYTVQFSMPHAYQGQPVRPPDTVGTPNEIFFMIAITDQSGSTAGGIIAQQYYLTPLVGSTVPGTGAITGSYTWPNGQNPFANSASAIWP
jgi:hypothetical protein